MALSNHYCLEDSATAIHLGQIISNYQQRVTTLLAWIDKIETTANASAQKCQLDQIARAGRTHCATLHSSA